MGDRIFTKYAQTLWLAGDGRVWGATPTAGTLQRKGSINVDDGDDCSRHQRATLTLPQKQLGIRKLYQLGRSCGKLSANQA
jgi:hypothetical protein